MIFLPANVISGSRETGSSCRVGPEVAFSVPSLGMRAGAEAGRRFGRLRSCLCSLGVERTGITGEWIRMGEDGKRGEGEKVIGRGEVGSGEEEEGEGEREKGGGRKGSGRLGGREGGAGGEGLSCLVVCCWCVVLPTGAACSSVGHGTVWISAVT